MNGSSSSYGRRQSASPDMDSSPRDSRSGERGSDRYSSSSYSQKMREKDRSDRDLYKKDKYLGNIKAGAASERTVASCIKFQL